MNILVVDDEKVIREGVRRTIIHSFPHMNIVTAGSAQEALLILRNQHVHVVFLDILMPGMSGLEMMAACIKTNPHTKWIVISAHSEFSFAQEALRLGAREYILKPIGKNKLIEVITTIEAELLSELSQSADTSLLHFNLKYLREAIFQRWAHGLDIGRFDISKLEESYPKFHLILIRLEDKIRDLTINHFIIENVLTELIEANGQGFVASLDHHSLLGIVSIHEGSRIWDLEYKILEHLNRYLKVPYQLRISDELTEFNSIPAEVRKFIKGETKPVSYLSMNKNEDMIDIAVQYIKNNFRENLSLEKVASIVFLSPVYFSQLFKHKTGSGYKDCVIQLRMEQAKELLSNSTMKITEVAAFVGYSDIRHFTHVFRKKYQLTPSQFRHTYQVETKSPSSI